MRDQTAQYLLADQREVAKQIKDLVTDKLILKTERCVVEHARLCQHDRILQRPAADQTVRLQFFNIVVKTESPGRSDEIRVIGSRELNFKALFPNQRMRKIDIVLD